MNKANEHTQKSSVPKIFYDIAFLTLVVPTILYTQGYMYKLGKFKFYGVPTDYIEVGYHDIIAVWALPLVFLFVLLLPLYPFLIPSHVLEGLIAEKETNKGNSWTDSKWFKPVLNMIFVLLMSLVSVVILAGLSDYWYFFRLIPALSGLFFFSIFLFWLQSRWKTKGSYRHKLLKAASFLLSAILLLIATSGMSEALGVFQAERKMKYQMVCSPEKNWVRIAKSGDKIIAKEVDKDTRKATGKTVLISGKCEDFVILEDVTFTREELGP